MRAGETGRALAELEPVLEFAGDIGADIVTIHANVPANGQDGEWQPAMRMLDSLAARHSLRVGLEITSGFEAVRALGLPCVGVTFDVGHMYLGSPPPIASFRQLGDVVRLLGPALVHLHLHDVRNGIDHVEPGTGEVDYASLFCALHEISYTGMLCLELNPDRVSPNGIAQARDWIANHWECAGPGW